MVNFALSEWMMISMGNRIWTQGLVVTYPPVDLQGHASSRDGSPANKLAPKSLAIYVLGIHTLFSCSRPLIASFVS